MTIICDKLWLAIFPLQYSGHIVYEFLQCIQYSRSATVSVQKGNDPGSILTRLGFIHKMLCPPPTHTHLPSQRACFRTHIFSSGKSVNLVCCWMSRVDYRHSVCYISSPNPHNAHNYRHRITLYVPCTRMNGKNIIVNIDEQLVSLSVTTCTIL